MELIPGLPNDIARDCLFRVTYKEFPTVISVSKEWKREVELPEFRRRRREISRSQKFIVVAQARVDPGKNSSVLKYRASPVYRFTLLEPDTGTWCELPALPEFSNGLPMFCQVVSVGLDLVVLGGLDPVTWEVSDSVFVFNFVSATWRRGADMPGVRRSFFGCASDSDRMVYVVGGHDGDKNALRSAMTYDVVKNEWTILPDMARERDECKAIFHRGKLNVIGGYCTEMQGQFERSSEVFNVQTWQWSDRQDDLLDIATCPKTCLYGSDEKSYTCRGSDVMTCNGMTWQSVAKLPADVSNTAYVATWENKLLVIGSARYGEPHMAYVLELKTYKWTKVDIPEQYSGHVQSGCYLEI